LSDFPEIILAETNTHIASKKRFSRARERRLSFLQTVGAFLHVASIINFWN
jgi:hypothetical protein